MPRLSAFEQVSLDGFFTDAGGDMSWAHKQDPEWNEFAASNAKGGGALLFGRVTYQMMERYWPSPAAREANAAVAEGMNKMPKVVFSRTLDKAAWSNTTLVKSDPAAAVRKMKSKPGPDMVILGSGTIVSQLAQAGLIDAYQIVVCPILLGKGRTLFATVDRKIGLRRTQARTFGNGNVVLSYEPVS